MPYEPPTHTVERSLRATTGAKVIAGVDEVGRGAWAGPVTVCAAITGLRRPPAGLTDSKLLTIKRRTELAVELRTWVTSCAQRASPLTAVEQHGGAHRSAASQIVRDDPAQLGEQRVAEHRIRRRGSDGWLNEALARSRSSGSSTATTAVAGSGAVLAECSRGK
ncbi:Ribonuclease HII [Streptomyces tendae]